jgi:Reverse transcriptase (RNA-dependent DNA polymerase)
MRVRCINCPKSFINNQAMERHLLESKRKCYDGVFPEGFDAYCEKNNRLLCIICNKTVSSRRLCAHLLELSGMNLTNIHCATELVPDAEIENSSTSETGLFAQNDIQQPAPVIAPDTAIQISATPVAFMGAALDIENRIPGDNPMQSISATEALKLCLENPGSVVQTIPEAARRPTADAFFRLLQAVTSNPNSEHAHARLLLFAPFVCARKRNKKAKLVTRIKQRAKLIITASLDEIIDVILQENVRENELSRVAAPSMKSIKRLISLGRYSDAIKMLTSNGVHPNSPEVFNSLLEKHPQADKIAPRDKVPQWVSFSREEVSNAIASFPNGSSGGPFAITVQFLKDMTGDAQLGDTVLNQLAKFAGMFVAGKFPGSMAIFYGSARLIPLIKKDGGVRPMAVGETLRRLSCKLALTLVNSEVPRFLNPHQLGVGTSQGAEAIVHTVASTLDNLADDEAILQIDFTNAFNLVSRNKMLDLVRINFPKLYNVVNFMYSNQGYLKIGHGKHTIYSCVGVQQGCPLAPLLFSLVLQELVSDLSSKVPHLKLNLWYLDDGHLSGKTVDLLAALALIRDVGPSLGLFLNLSKCVVFGKCTADFPSVIKRNPSGLVVLGSPIGSKSFVSEHINRIVCDAALILLQSQALMDPQKELLLLRCCSGATKMVYWLRTCRPDFLIDDILKFDRVIDDALQHILGVPITGDKRITMHLPLSFGGLGIPIASITKEAAFVSSVGSSWKLQPVEKPRHGFNEAIGILQNQSSVVPILPSKNISDVSPQFYPAKEFKQSNFMQAINSKLLDGIMMTMDEKTKLILKGRACKGANYWLTTVPNRWNNTEIEPAAFRSLLKYSTGIPLMAGDQPCPDCHKMQDKFGHHAISCKVASGKIGQHNSIVEGISIQLRKASINHCVEEFNPSNSSRQRPGDIYMPDFDTYGDAFFDVSVISICADSYWKRAAKGQLEGSKIRYKAKMKKYPDLGSRLKPLVLESTGGWNAYSFDYLRKLADHIAARTNKVAKVALNFLLTSASVRLQRNQGTMLVRRCLGL